jgi:hypothetical protein
MRNRLAIVCVILLGCSTDDPSGGAGSEVLPTLEVTSPQRGTFATGESVTVSGNVSGDHVQLSVNGQNVEPNSDGSFSTAVRVTDGIAIFETQAKDKAGHEVQDVRAVLVGTTKPTDGSLAAPIGAHAGTAGLKQIGDVIANGAEAIDFNAIAQGMNPVYDNGGCLGMKVNLTNVTLGAIGATLSPKSNALGTAVTIDNVTVRLNAGSFKVACLGVPGSVTITVHATRARITGDLGATLTTGRVDASIANVGVAFDGYTIDVGGIPSQLENLVKDRARAATEGIVATAIRDRVPGLAEGALGNLLAKPFNANLLGHDTQISVAPKQLQIAPEGVFIAVDTAVKVSGGEGGTFVSTPAPLLASTMKGPHSFAIALSDDLGNQLFASLWAAGAFDMQFPIAQVGPLSALLDDDTKTVEIKLALPPMLTTDAAAQLTVGELTLSAKDAAGTEIQRLGVALRTTLAVEPAAGKLSLVLGAPEVHAQVMVQGPQVDFPLTAKQIEGIVEGVWGVVGGAASDALATLPMPSFAGLQLGQPSIAGHQGFVIANIE